MRAVQGRDIPVGVEHERVQQVDREADHAEPGAPAGHPAVARGQAEPERGPGQQHRGRPLDQPLMAHVPLLAVPEARERGQREHADDDRRGHRPAGARLPLLGAVDQRAGEHQGQDHAPLPRRRRSLVDHDQDERGEAGHGRPGPGHPGPRRDREQDAGQDQRVGGGVERQPAVGGVARPVGQRRHRQHAAEGHRADRENRRVAAAAPVHPPAEQRHQQQVEDHLVGQGPGHVGHVGAGEQVRQHEQPGEHGLGGVVLGPPDRAVSALVGDDGDDQGHQVHRVQPEQPAGPESAHGSLALQRGRDDVPADQEEHEDAVLAEVEPAVQEVPDRLEHQRGPVVEHHAQRGESAQRVQPRQPTVLGSCPLAAFGSPTSRDISPDVTAPARAGGGAERGGRWQARARPVGYLLCDRASG